MRARSFTRVRAATIAFVLTCAGIGCAQTAEHAAVAASAPTQLRGSAFGLLTTVRAVGSLAASTIAGLLYTLASPTVLPPLVGCATPAAASWVGWVRREGVVG